MNNNEGNGHFTVLENRQIAQNLVVFRNIRGKKAFDVAESIGMSESAYTKYERGESKITVDFIQKVAEVLEVDPLTLLSAQPTSFFKSGDNSPNSAIGVYGEYHYQGIDKELFQAVIRALEESIAMNKRFMDYVREKDK